MKPMRVFRTSLICLGALVATLAGVKPTHADFTFGQPMIFSHPINDMFDDSGPCLSTDGLSLYFASARLSDFGIGNSDLWVLTRETPDGPWTKLASLGRTVNTVHHDGSPCISTDGLSLYFCSARPGGHGNLDLWMTTRESPEQEWGTPVNLGPAVNSPQYEDRCYVSPDGLSLLFDSDRPGGEGGWDISVSTRPTTNDAWGEPANLGPPVNSPSADGEPTISDDGQVLFFTSNRPGGHGGLDLWMARWDAARHAWGAPANLGASVNRGNTDGTADISPDGSTLYFSSYFGFPPGSELLYISLLPVVDFNSDGKVDVEDLLILVEHWGQNEPAVDIGPMPWGDGTIDVQDLKVLLRYWEQANGSGDSAEDSEMSASSAP